MTDADRLMGSYRRWPFLAIVAAVLFSGACQPDRQAVSSVQTEIVSATLVPPAELALPAGLGVTAALRLPGGVHARNYGARAGQRYLAFGIGLQSADGSEAPLPAGRKAEYGVADLATGRIVIHRAEQSGATADINVVFSAPNGEWLVRREDRSRPAQACPQSPQYCWDWTLYAQHLPDGPSTVIAGSIRPGPQFFLPQPALSAQSVLWLDASTAPAGTADLVQWQPSRGVSILAKAIPFGRLSATDTDGWVGTDDRGGHQLLRIPTNGTATSTATLPPGSDSAVVRADQVAYIIRPPANASVDALTKVVTAPSTKPTYSTVIFTDHDIYTLNWAGASAVAISTSTGYLRATTTGTSPLPIALLSGLHNDLGRLTFTIDLNGIQVLAVAHG